MMRIGHGYDVHRLTADRKLILGGVEIPHSTGLLGHSDADVLLHAVCDSLLGAAALGDLGAHFPDTDEKYKGVSSLELLKQTADLLKKSGFKVVNVDVTVIAQSPKLAPYISKMVKNTADALGVETGAVSIKATTEESLGFTGRKEGIAAHAVCLIDNL
ncbi:MAG: 2-C-methyl-D-erythritol 2,4-cyclodiphosphate synthase [Clostridia bacterium]|nr:2-C-methyl-D-erythritol 2,4-cyclodiphosphate synthase [Clostridia bacterium]